MDARKYKYTRKAKRRLAKKQAVQNTTKPPGSSTFRNVSKLLGSSTIKNVNDVNHKPSKISVTNRTPATDPAPETNQEMAPERAQFSTSLVTKQKSRNKMEKIRNAWNKCKLSAIPENPTAQEMSGYFGPKWTRPRARAGLSPHHHAALPLLPPLHVPATTCFQWPKLLGSTMFGSVSDVNPEPSQISVTNPTPVEPHNSDPSQVDDPDANGAADPDSNEATDSDPCEASDPDLNGATDPDPTEPTDHEPNGATDHNKRHAADPDHETNPEKAPEPANFPASLSLKKNIKKKRRLQKNPAAQSQSKNATKENMLGSALFKCQSDVNPAPSKPSETILYSVKTQDSCPSEATAHNQNGATDPDPSPSTNCDPGTNQEKVPERAWFSASTAEEMTLLKEELGMTECDTKSNGTKLANPIPNPKDLGSQVAGGFSNATGLGSGAAAKVSSTLSQWLSSGQARACRLDGGTTPPGYENRSPAQEMSGYLGPELARATLCATPCHHPAPTLLPPLHVDATPCFQWPKHAAVLLPDRGMRQGATPISQELRGRLQELRIYRGQGHVRGLMQGMEGAAMASGILLPRGSVRISFDTFLANSRPGLETTSEEMRNIGGNILEQKNDFIKPIIPDKHDKFDTTMYNNSKMLKPSAARFEKNKMLHNIKSLQATKENSLGLRLENVKQTFDKLWTVVSNCKYLTVENKRLKALEENNKLLKEENKRLEALEENNKLLKEDNKRLELEKIVLETKNKRKETENTNLKIKLQNIQSLNHTEIGKISDTERKLEIMTELFNREQTYSLKVERKLLGSEQKFKKSQRSSSELLGVVETLCCSRNSSEPKTGSEKPRPVEAALLVARLLYQHPGNPRLQHYFVSSRSFENIACRGSLYS